jgi:hypothetical protein
MFCKRKAHSYDCLHLKKSHKFQINWSTIEVLRKQEQVKSQISTWKGIVSIWGKVDEMEMKGMIQRFNETKEFVFLKKINRFTNP